MPANRTTEGADGLMDLTLKFDAASVAGTVGPTVRGDVHVLTLTATLEDGSSILGSDIVVIV